MTSRVMIVEDNELNLKLFTDLMRAQGFEVAPLRDGVALIERVAEFAPDLIIMDIQLGASSGLDLIESLKADPAARAIPILAVTAYAGKGDEERILTAGADHYVSKPIGVVKFLEAVRHTLGK